MYAGRERSAEPNCPAFENAAAASSYRPAFNRQTPLRTWSAASYCDFNRSINSVGESLEERVSFGWATDLGMTFSLNGRTHSRRGISVFSRQRDIRRGATPIWNRL